MIQTLRFLCVGDVVGQPGVSVFQRWVPKLKQKYAIDAVIVNGENAAKNGKGLTAKTIDFFKHNGADIVTTGNHVWEQREIYTALNERDDVTRPANYPPGCPGKGYAFCLVKGVTVAVVNLHGRVFIHDLLDCPFRAVESLLTFITTKTNIIFVDFHAEASSEKNAMGLYLDGKVSCVFGTHTHVQTADERILPQGTGYITDLGSCSAQNSIIGMQQTEVLQKFLFHPRMGKFVVEHKGPIVFSGALVEVDVTTGKTVKIERVHIVDEEMSTSTSGDVAF
jgi:2',3'-cyclic-nucleotide 2'-phosphodiesterase